MQDEVKPINLAAQAKLFKRYKGGDAGSLMEFLENERSPLYDYLMRMTGQISRSFESVSEVFQSLAEGEAKLGFDSVEELRVCLYVTARKFNADIWNADTTLLINAAIESPLAEMSGGRPLSSAPNPEPVSRELLAYRALDKSLRSLPAKEREIVLLRSRSYFEFEGIAEIMLISETEAESVFYRGMQRIDADCSGIVEQPERMLAKLAGHPAPEDTEQSITNLSVMMHDIKAKPVGMWSPLRVILLLFILIVAAAYLFYPSQLRQFWHRHVTSGVSDSSPDSERPTP